MHIGAGVSFLFSAFLKIYKNNQIGVHMTIDEIHCVHQIRNDTFYRGVGYVTVKFSTKLFYV